MQEIDLVPTTREDTDHRKARLGPGVVDAAISSLATFLAGLVAANILDAKNLGVYAVFFTAFNFGQVIANNLVYIPAEVAAVAWPVESRLRVISQSIPLSIVPSLAGGLAIGIASLVTAQIAEASIVVPLTITTGITTLVWPTQDHIRRTLHIADRSWAAATVSTAQLAVAAVSIGALLVADVPAAWIPFGALAIANVVSLLIGIVLVRMSLTSQLAPERLHLRNLTKSGMWLLIGVGTPTVTAFGAATIITFAAGPEALGFAEAARIVAHPVLVLGTGLGYVLGPRIMRGAIARDRSVSRKSHLRFNSIVLSAALVYTAVAGWRWAGNPMTVLVPDAFEVAWLVPATIAANVMMAAVVLVIQELMAARKARTIAIVSLVSAPLQLAVAATAGVTEAFARPLSLAVGNASRLVGNSRSIRYAYEPAHRPKAGSPPSQAS